MNDLLNSIDNKYYNNYSFRINEDNDKEIEIVVKFIETNIFIGEIIYDKVYDTYIGRTYFDEDDCDLRGAYEYFENINDSLLYIINHYINYKSKVITNNIRILQILKDSLKF